MRARFPCKVRALVAVALPPRRRAEARRGSSNAESRTIRPPGHGTYAKAPQNLIPLRRGEQKFLQLSARPQPPDRGAMELAARPRGLVARSRPGEREAGGALPARYPVAPGATANRARHERLVSLIGGSPAHRQPLYRLPQPA